MRFLTILTTFSAGLAILSLGSAVVRAGEDISGAWEVEILQFGLASHHRLTLDKSEEGYTGRMSALRRSWHITGTVEGDRAILICRASAEAGSRSCGTFNAQAKDGTLKGGGTFFGSPITLTGGRSSQPPESGPAVHDFDPVTFALNFSDTPEPVLRVHAGDTINTRTIDAGGIDEKEERAWTFGNPQTGPFYVNGAMPGDTLVVDIKRLTLNRDMASMYGNQVAANALNPFYVRDTEQGNKADGLWTTDREAGTASLTNPSEKLKNFVIDLKPMLGGVGVAPPSDQSIRAGDLGSFGGNMDYLGVAEGARLYLPVYQRGAYLYFGDAHATQSDGELTGTGLETSMDVSLAVDLIEGWNLGQPWLEDAEHVMVMGIAGSLDDALREATTGMARWLTHTYGLDSSEIAMVMGTSLRYDIAEIVDPHINVVARISKDVLAGIAVRDKNGGEQ
jgi:amidase